jgi:hypothetical protein
MVGLGGGRKQWWRREALLLPVDMRERPGDGKGEMERRDRETGEAEWKLRLSPREQTDARSEYFRNRNDQESLSV